jgi:large subunit ribosomal protein L6
MSRIGIIPIKIPKGVDVKVDDNVVTVKGPKGTLTQEFLNEIVSINIEDDVVKVTLNEGKEDKNAFQGLYRSLISNMVTGVTQEFQKQLELIGVGFRAAVKGKFLDLQVGYSHPVEIPIPEGIAVKVDKNTLVTVTGADKQKVGQFAAFVREKRKPEPYKGKGVRYLGEQVRKKAGKAGKAGK